MWFLYVEWQIWRVSDTRLKSDGHGYEFLPADTGTVQISTRSLFAGGRVIALSDLNLTRCHP
jgi:hypothetical protein